MHNKLRTILTASLAYTLTSNAAIDLTISYNSELNSTTLSYSGSWETIGLTGTDPTGYQAGDGWSLTHPSRIYAMGKTPHIWYTHGDASLTSTPFIELDLGNETVEGDAWGFSEATLFAPVGYVAGDSINGSVTFQNTTLSDIGLDPVEIANGGVISGLGAGNDITWSVIPEPSQYTVVLSSILVACIAFTRRRR